MSKSTVIAKKVRVSSDQIAVNVLGWVLIGIFALFCVLPFYLIIVASFTAETSLIREGYPLIPRIKDISLDAYKLSLKNPMAIIISYATTIGVTAVGTFVAVLLATMTGYVLSRKDNKYMRR